MKKVRDLIFLFLVTTTFGVSLNLLRHAVGKTSPWFVLIAMFDFLGLAAFARPLFLLRMPPVLREVRAWEIHGLIYRRAGVAAFGALLQRSPLRYLNSHVYLRRYPDDLALAQRQMEAAEAAHFWAATLIIPYMIYAAMREWWSVIFGFMAVEMFVNVYPILHLRWVRGRLKRILDRKNHVPRFA